MQYPSSWDLETKAITVGALLIWVAAVGVCIWAILRTHGAPMKLVVAITSLPPLALVPLLALWSPLSYELDGTGLRILRRAGAVEIPLGTIREVTTLEDGIRLRRVFGVGGSSATSASSMRPGSAGSRSTQPRPRDGWRSRPTGESSW